MKDHKYLLVHLQERFKQGGYVLVAPKSGRVYAYGKNLENMFSKIKKQNIPILNKHVMFVPRKDVRYIV